MALGVLEEKEKPIKPLDSDEEDNKETPKPKNELIISTADEHKKKELLAAQQADLAVLNIMKAFYCHSDTEDDDTNEEEDQTSSEEDSSEGE